MECSHRQRLDFRPVQTRAVAPFPLHAALAPRYRVWRSQPKLGSPEFESRPARPRALLQNGPWPLCGSLDLRPTWRSEMPSRGSLDVACEGIGHAWRLDAATGISQSWFRERSGASECRGTSRGRLAACGSEENVTS